MKTLPDKSVDLFLCDLPYGCLETRRKERTEEYARKGNGGGGGCAWDIKLDLAQFWAQVERLMKDEHTPIIQFCNARFGFELYNSKPEWFRYDLVWNKMRGVSFLQANKMPMRSHENIYVFAKKGARYYRKDIKGTFTPQPAARSEDTSGFSVYSIGSKTWVRNENDGTHRCALSVVNASSIQQKGRHPTQKPNDLYMWLIERYSKEGDTILDPTAGSFSSVFTAEKLGRKGIGIEKDEKFYNKAVSLVSE